MLGALGLSDTHRAALRQRGLSDDEIYRCAYRTLPVHGRPRLARDLRVARRRRGADRPRLHPQARQGRRPYLTIAGAPGCWSRSATCPGESWPFCRAATTLSQGGGKYSYLSSAKHGGPGPGAPPHVPLGVTAPAETVRLTEGTLKADIAFALSGLATVGAAGLGWRPALDMLATLGCKTIRLAFDADALDNPNVARALLGCSEAAAALGLAIEMEQQDRSDGKGIDDLLVAGKTPEVLTGEPRRWLRSGRPWPPRRQEGRRSNRGNWTGSPTCWRRAASKPFSATGSCWRQWRRLAENDPAEYACRRGPSCSAPE